MTRISQVLVAVLIAFTISACGSDSKFPVASGKGSIRRIATCELG
jgi:hypothetical protein